MAVWMAASLPVANALRSFRALSLSSRKVLSLSCIDLPPLPRNTPLAPRSRCRLVTKALTRSAVALAVTVCSMFLSVS